MRSNTVRFPRVQHPQHHPLQTITQKPHQSVCVSQRKVSLDLSDYTLNLTSVSHHLLLTSNRKEIMSPRCVTNKGDQWWWWWRRLLASSLDIQPSPLCEETMDHCESVGRDCEQCDLLCRRHRLADETVIILSQCSDVGMMQTVVWGQTVGTCGRKIICFGRK